MKETRAPAAAPPGSALPWLAGLFVAALITSNIIAVKLVAVGGLVLPAAVILFPVSYILGDVLTEVYGYAQARRVIWLGFACNALAVIAIAISMELPAAAFWQGQAAYEQVLGLAPRIVAASFAAYLVGEFANAYVLARLKVATGGRWLWTRTIGSTVVGQGLDSAVFITIAFAGVIPLGGMAAAIAGQWLVKTLYEVVATPVTYAVIGMLKRREGVDVFDDDTDFNPLRLARGPGRDALSPGARG